MRNIVLIFGITGDLSKRMLLPSLAYLCNNKKIPNIILYGVSRRDINPEDLFPSHPFIEFNGIKLNDSLLEYVDFLKKLDLKKEDQLYIYLSTPPSSALMYVEMLGQAGFNKDNVKLLLEKPFGTDYDSASSFLSVINKWFKEEQVYKVDHYLAKRNSQIIFPFKEANKQLFKKYFNKDYVKKIDVIGLEQLDIQGRSVFYEQTGALRDFIQGHLMELLILTLSSSLSERVSCINQLYIPNYEECVNAQYEGYKQEVGNKSSVTETFAKVTVYSKNPLFQSIPLNLITGKGLDIKESSINISWKNDKQTKIIISPYIPLEKDTVIYNEKAVSISDNFLDGYNAVFFNVFNNNKSVFTSNDEILQSWKIFDPLLKKWYSQKKIKTYKKGSNLKDII